MKSLKIEVPEGYEVDKDKSTFENIVFKKINEFSNLPKSVKEIEGRCYYINNYGAISTTYTSAPNNLSTKERAEAFLALMQLVELRDVYNEGWKPDWNYEEYKKHCIFFEDNKVKIDSFYYHQRVLHFKSKELAELFSEEFSDLIEQAKELL